MKKCSYCGEKIQSEAMVCRCCGRQRMQLTRREFLKVAGMTIPAALLGACAPGLVPEAGFSAKPSAEPTHDISAIPAPPCAAPTKAAIDALAPDMVLVEAGSFEMGSADGYHHERPVHTVRITRSFFMGRYEVTFDEYDRYCEDTGSLKPDDRGHGRGRMPVIHVDWYDVVAYCNWLSEKEGLNPCYSGGGRNTICDFSADGYRLPTEAEWEYAARGGQQSQGYAYAGSNDPDEVAWYQANSDDQPRPVGEKTPNELGLHDMSGNMFEWCWDWYAEDYYTSSPVDDPQGPPNPASSKPWDLLRARRSGNWREKADSIRTTARSFDGDTYPGDNGFRLVRTA